MIRTCHLVCSRGLLLAGMLFLPAWMSGSIVHAQTASQAATNHELAQQTRQAIFFAQRQLPQLEQDAQRSQANWNEAKQLLDERKKQVALLTQAIADLKTAETKSKEALATQEEQVKTQTEKLKQLRAELAPDPVDAKQKDEQQRTLEMKLAEAKKAAEELQPKLAGLEQAVAFNHARRTELVALIGQLDANLRAAREAELQSNQRVDDAKATKTKLTTELERLEKLATEQKAELQAALKEAKAAATAAQEQAGKFKTAIDDASAKPVDTSTSKPVPTEPVTSEPIAKDQADSKQAAGSSIAKDSATSANPIHSALASYQVQMGNLSDSYQRTAQLMSASRVTMQQLLAARAAIANEESRLTELTQAHELVKKQVDAARERLAAAEKEMETLSEATSKLRDKQAELKTSTEQAVATALAAEKELAEFVRARSAPLSQADQLLLRSKTAAVTAAETDLAQLNQQRHGTADRVRQLTTAIQFNEQALESAKWYEQVATHVAEVRQLEQSTAAANLAAVKAAFESLNNALQRLDLR